MRAQYCSHGTGAFAGGYEARNQRKQAEKGKTGIAKKAENSENVFIALGAITPVMPQNHANPGIS
jgi:hypothetical protein